MRRPRRKSSVFLSQIEPLEGRTLLDGVGPRIMENLDRGVVAVRASSTAAFVSWRLLGLDPSDIAFNIYRSTNGGAPTKLNASPLTGGTNFSDTSANLTSDNTYHVRPVLGGAELAASGSFTLSANHAVEPIVRIPLQTPLAGYYTKFAWVGDLDGDREYDYVIDRLAPFDPNNDDIGLGNQFLEAYTRTGVRLWQIDLGPTSRNTYNIEPGAATLSMGNWDGVTVRDMDSDGRAEVLLKTANGVVFGDGAVLTAANNNLQFVSVINGLTGAERARIQFANDYISDGAMGMIFGVGSVDGVNPALYIKAKNRVGSGSFNQTVQAYSFDGTTITRLWKWNRGTAPAPDGHQIRIVDLDGDGRDEYCDIGFALNSDGTFRYSLQTIGGIAHGDRFHIADMDPSRPGLEGYGVQQNDGQIGQPNRILEYYYDAATGQILWTHLGTGSDVGRGMAADIDPRFPGMEVWSFSGLFNGPSNQLTEPNTGLRPWPQLGLWWDGDTMHELLNDGKFEYWDWLNPRATNSLPRFFRASTYGAVGSGVNPLMYGDILGDWREEVVYTNSAQNELLIFTTPIESSNRIYTLAHNPAYRNGMTIKGYMQSHHLDYFLGDGMSAPPVPNIVYVDTTAPTVSNAGYHFATAPNRLEFTFDEPVTIASGAASLLVTLQGGGGIVAGVYNYEPLTNTASFTLPVGLSDGNYTATFVPGSVTDAFENPLSSTYSFNFYVLAADANRDRRVDVTDLTLLAANWLGTGKTFGEGDFSYDGVVNKVDLGMMAERWHVRVDAPAVPAAPAPTVARRAPTRTPTRVIDLVT